MENMTISGESIDNCIPLRSLDLWTALTMVGNLTKPGLALHIFCSVLDKPGARWPILPPFCTRALNDL